MRVVNQGLLQTGRKKDRIEYVADFSALKDTCQSRRVVSVLDLNPWCSDCPLVTISISGSTRTVNKDNGDTRFESERPKHC